MSNKELINQLLTINDEIEEKLINKRPMDEETHKFGCLLHVKLTKIVKDLVIDEFGIGSD